MNYYHIITIVAGVAALVWGFVASFEKKRPWDIIGAIVAPLGLLAIIIGTLLLCVPNFLVPYS